MTVISQSRHLDRAVLSVGGTRYTYDAVGNLTAQGTARDYTWSADNQPTAISSGGATEQYRYDGDGERLTRLHDGLTTFYRGRGAGGGLAERGGSGAPHALQL